MNTAPVSATTFDPQALRQSSQAAVALLKMLGNEDRLLILCQLSLGECAVSELEQRLGIRQPTLSQQLAVLRSEGVVSTRREGKAIYYAIAQTEVLRLLQTLHELFCQDMTA